MIWACLLVTAAAFYYVFHVPQAVALGPEKTRLNYLQERKEVVYENLRDLNFEHSAGKLAESDYRNMRSSLEDEAAAILAEMARLQSGSTSKQVSPNKG